MPLVGLRTTLRFDTENVLLRRSQNLRISVKARHSKVESEPIRRGAGCSGGAYKVENLKEVRSRSSERPPISDGSIPWSAG